jgi:hypothetical protein
VTSCDDSRFYRLLIVLWPNASGFSEKKQADFRGLIDFARMVNRSYVGGIFERFGAIKWRFFIPRRNFDCAFRFSELCPGVGWLVAHADLK